MTTLSKRVSWPRSQIVNSQGEVIDFLSVTSGDTTSSGIFILDEEGNVTDLSSISAEGAVGSGGNNTYDNIADFQAEVVADSTDVTISEISFPLEAKNVVAGRLIRINSSGIKTVESFTGVTVSSSTISFLGIDNFSSDDSIYLEIKGPDKNRDKNQDNLKVSVENSNDDSYLPLESDTLSGINDRIYSTLRFNNRYRKTDIAYALSDSTGFELKIFGTWDEDATDPTDGNDPSSAWKDLTTEIFGGAISGTTLQSSHGIFEGMPYKLMSQVTLGNADGSSTIEWRNFNF